MLFSRQFQRVGLVLLMVLGACDPRVFDDLGAKAPVQVAETPSGLDHFGPAIIGLDRRGGSADRPQLAVVAGGGTEALVVIHGLSDGRVERRSGGESPETGTAGAVMALAQTGLLSGPEGTTPGVIVGVPQFDIVYAATVGETGEPMALADGVVRAGDCDIPPDEEFGGGLAVADLDGDGTDEWIIRSRYRLCAVNPSDPAAHHWSCHLSPACVDCDGFHSWQGPVAVGRLLALPDLRSTLVVGRPSESRGYVQFAGWSGPGPVVDASCDDAWMLTVDLQGPDGAASFGSALLVEDVDGDGWDELIVGAPGEQKVFVYSVPGGDRGQWIAAAPVAVITAQDETTTRAFGTSLVLADLDGDGHLELAVGDPDATVGGEELAGRVHLFSLDLGFGGATHLGVVEEHEPGRTHHLGKALGRIVPSGETWTRAGGVAHELVVGADEAVYLFLETGTEGDAWK